MKYISVKKVAWDMLWHASYIASDGKEYYNRVTKKEAMRISKNLARE